MPGPGFDIRDGIHRFHSQLIYEGHVARAILKDPQCYSVQREKPEAWPVDFVATGKPFDTRSKWGLLLQRTLFMDESASLDEHFTHVSQLVV